MRFRTTALCAFSIASLSSSIGCADDYLLERTQDHVAKMRSFRGQLVETGVLASGEMRSSVVFRRPSQFVSRVVAPESYAGVTLAYTGTTLTIYYPKSHYAIVFDHLHELTPDEEREVVAHAYKHGHARYRYSLGGSGRAGKLPTLEMTARPILADEAHPTIVSQIYDRLSFPVAGTVRWKDATYTYRFDDLAFDVPVYDAELALPIPADTLVARWDLAAPALTLAQLHEQAGFDYALPVMTLPPERIVRQAGPVPAFTLQYRGGAERLLVSIFRDPGVRPASEDHGVPVTIGEKHGHLVIGATISSYTFTLRGTMYVLTATLPFDELLEIAETIK